MRTHLDYSGKTHGTYFTKNSQYQVQHTTQIWPISFAISNNSTTPAIKLKLMYIYIDKDFLDLDSIYLIQNMKSYNNY